MFAPACFAACGFNAAVPDVHPVGVVALYWYAAAALLVRFPDVL
ncbi:MAG: hypothetical protein AB7L13_17100 [Acidimicrobiia bacterium]